MYPQDENKSNEFFEYFMPCQKQVYRYLFRLVHNETDAEDLLQETAKAMWQQFDKFDPEQNFLAWAIGIARNKCFTFLKQKSKNSHMLSEETYRMISEMKYNDKGDNEKKKRFLKDCMERLKTVDKKILHLKYEEGQTSKSIAEKLGRSTDGIYHTMARIHNLLHRCINHYILADQQRYE